MQVVVWLLKHCLLIQLHTYVFLVPGPKGTGVMASESKLTGTKSALTIPRQVVSPSSLEDLPLFKAHSASDVNSGTLSLLGSVGPYLVGLTVAG